MMTRNTRSVILSLLILAFATMGISPACAFISGTMDVEICLASGDLKTVQVPVEGGSSHHAKNAGDCLFCFVFAHGQCLKAPDNSIMAGVRSDYLQISGGSFIPHGYAFKHFLSTGPPASLS